MLWTHALRWSGEPASLSMGTTGMSILKPGEEKTVSCTYQSSKSGPYGEFRLITTAVFYKGWGDITTGDRTAAGAKVQEILKALDKRVEDAGKKK